MSHFVTNDVLSVWYEELNKNFGCIGCQIEREYAYIHKPLPFRALHMGKRYDEYFLDSVNVKIPIGDLMNDLNLLIIKDFQFCSDLSSEDKQAKKATSRADLFVANKNVEIIIELEVFKDKPFSNLIYIPEVCKRSREKPLHFVHCFAPHRQDKEAELTQLIGQWLMKHDQIMNFQYESYVLPKLPHSIEYLLPNKRAPKPKAFRENKDVVEFHQYAKNVCERVLAPSIRRILSV